jgi:hypothetical protein
VESEWVITWLYCFRLHRNDIEDTASALVPTINGGRD